MWTSKYTRSAEWFFFDFAPQLAVGDSLSSLIEIVQEAGDCTLATPGRVGSVASVFVTAGTPGVSVTLRAVAQTTLGETLEVRGMFKVLS